MDAESRELAVVIGRNLHKYRTRAGLTQAELAEAVGVGNAFISRAERGEKLMKLKTLYSIANVLRIGCDALVYDENKSSHLRNIQRMLSDQSPEFISGMEELIRICVNRFG